MTTINSQSKKILSRHGPNFDSEKSMFNLTSTKFGEITRFPAVLGSPRNTNQTIHESFSMTPKKRKKYENLDFVKKQNKLKLNTSHHMIRAMVLVEDEKEASKDKSAYNRSFKRMSAGLKMIVGITSLKQNLLHQITENLQPISEKSKHISNIPKEPLQKWTESNQEL